MSDSHSSDSHSIDASGIHIAKDSLYFAILGALLVLTAVTVWVSFLDLGWANDIVALAVAFSKASLVILFFMHVKYLGNMTKLLVACGLVWMGLMFLLTYMDYASRSAIVDEPQAVYSDWVDPDAIAGGHGEGSGEDHSEDDDH